MANKKYLITSALPYVNGELHIGHLVGCYLPSDVYARFIRAKYGRDNVLFICGADEHGTPSVIGAAKEGVSPLEYNNKYYEKQKRAVADFKLSFDLYGRTHTELHKELVQSLFTRLDKAGLIEERESEQMFSITDNLFLSDRFIKGTCPKCGYDRADGDQCEKCGVLLEPTELINPYSAISGSHDIELRKTKHLYFRASAMEGRLREWIDSRVGWPKTATAIANKWLSEGLRDTPITRDLPWGIPVNKPGYENKVFYVWFDAPWGYVSISQAATPDWAKWWKAGDNCHYAQFMGKDNVAFHAVFFPEQQLAADDNWKTVDMLKAVNFLNFEGAKISKSTGNGVFLDKAIEDAPADAWRYALMASAPETDDTDFTIQRFADIVNKDLNGMLGNFVSRVCKITEKNFGNKVPPFYKDYGDGAEKFAALEKDINAKLAELTDALEKCEFRASVAALRSLWAIGNEFMTVMEPWTLVKNGDLARAGAVLDECFQLIDLYACVSAPFIPDAAAEIQKIFGGRHDLSWPEKYEWRIADGEEFSVPDNLFSRIDDDKITAMVEKYTKKSPKLVIAKILSVEPHPESDRLNVLSVDAGEGKPLQIVCACPNVHPGLVSVLAKVGATLPGQDAPITARKMRGIVSYGMMCGPDEVGLSDKYEEHLVELPEDSVIGAEFKIK
ncbi:MAG: methionine--tRNA ligase [Alphaproteobacteria bacterium]|nr:methionine--tRNA ligase [Alphaproteobacteria bacterium]